MYVKNLIYKSFLLIVLFFIANTQVLAKVYPLEEWAKRADIRNVSMSPDGEKVALMRIMEVEGNPILEVYDANDLSKRPFRMDADPMEITRFYWVTDDKIVFSARQKVRDKIDGFNRGVYEYSGGILTLDRNPKKSSWKKLNSIGRGGIVSTLPKYPDNIIISGYPRNSRGTIESFSRVYYNYNIKTDRKKVITRESEKREGIGFDEDANPRFATGDEPATDSTVYYYREKDSTEWDIIYRRHRADWEEWQPQGWDPDNPNNIIIDKFKIRIVGKGFKQQHGFKGGKILVAGKWGVVNTGKLL